MKPKGGTTQSPTRRGTPKEVEFMNTYILRWNPAISSYKKKAHLNLISHLKKGQLPTQFDWSVREWEKLKKDDFFILQQVGTENDGIAMIGKFAGQ